MDLSKLTPFPWEAIAVDTDEGSFDLEGPAGECVGNIECKDDAEFIALAQGAFDVMMRRGWWAIQTKVVTEDEFPPFLKGHGTLWRVSTFCVPQSMAKFARDQIATNPFTALVEADAWYKANVEKEVTK